MIVNGAHRTSPQRPLPVTVRLRNRRRPMLPKHRQLQNSTLSIHTPVSIVWWWPASIPLRLVGAASGAALLVPLRVFGLPSRCRDGVGIMSGLMPRRSREPTRPTAAESTRPVLERSISHHRSGLARASVAEIWSVEDQASLRCSSYISTKS